MTVSSHAYSEEVGAYIFDAGNLRDIEIEITEVHSLSVDYLKIRSGVRLVVRRATQKLIRGCGDP